MPYKLHFLSSNEISEINIITFISPRKWSLLQSPGIDEKNKLLPRLNIWPLFLSCVQGSETEM